GAREGVALSSIGARFAKSFVQGECRRKIASFSKAPPQHDSVFDRQRRSLPKKGRHRMRRIAEEGHTTRAPSRERRPIVETPLEYCPGLDCLDQAADLIIEVGI